MKKLENKQMETMNGGSFMGCAGVALGAIGMVAIFTAAAPVTLAGTLWVMTTTTATGMGFGLSLADCAL